MARVCQADGIVAMLNPSPQMSAAAATAYADRHGSTKFDRVSFINWGNVAEQAYGFSVEQITEMFEAAGLSEIVIEAKIGGLALLAKGRKMTGFQELLDQIYEQYRSDFEPVQGDSLMAH